MKPVILSGGSGVRLWPLSRTKLPKQFCQIFSDSLQNLTLKRLVYFGDPWIITGEHLKDLTFKSLNDLNLSTKQIICEPCSKNTAPAIALITHIFQMQGLGSEIIGIFPADHLIEKEKDFFNIVSMAVNEAKKNHIVTLGISPTFPATGFGYIQTSPPDLAKDNINNEYAVRIHPVKMFHEKPSADQAKKFLEDGCFFWNAGIFVFNVNLMADMFKKHKPDMWNMITQIRNNLENISDIYHRLENVSIDYAIMEKLDPGLLHCIPCSIGWNDVGSWDAVAALSKNDKDQQTTCINSSNNYIHKYKNKNYGLIDVNDLIIVDSADATLISKKNSTQKVKNVVEQLKEQNAACSESHIYENRPWGYYEILLEKAHFKSKIITVNSKQQLSYQSHSKREEHWIVTRGDGEMTLNDEVTSVKQGSYIKIPCGAKHRIKNIGLDILEFVEIQIGFYFGEDDIVRYQDDYDRLK